MIKQGGFIFFGTKGLWFSGIFGEVNSLPCALKISFELRLTKFLLPFKMCVCVEVKGSICCIPLSIVWCTLIKGNPSDVFNASTKVTSEFVDLSLKMMLRRMLVHLWHLRLMLC